jgi:hypothetical protein
MTINPAKIVFESSDLVRLIYSFGDPTHRRLTEEIAQSLNIHGMRYNISTLLTEVYDEFCVHHEYLGFYAFVGLLTPETALDLLNKFTRCYCCERHSKRKPFYANGKCTIPSYQVVTETNAGNTCSCRCRQYSRFIAQNLDDRNIIQME